MFVLVSSLDSVLTWHHSGKKENVSPPPQEEQERPLKPTEEMAVEGVGAKCCLPPSATSLPLTKGQVFPVQMSLFSLGFDASTEWKEDELILATSTLVHFHLQMRTETPAHCEPRRLWFR